MLEEEGESSIGGALGADDGGEKASGDEGADAIGDDGKVPLGPWTDASPLGPAVGSGLLLAPAAKIGPKE